MPHDRFIETHESFILNFQKHVFNPQVPHELLIRLDENMSRLVEAVSACERVGGLVVVVLLYFCTAACTDVMYCTIVLCCTVLHCCTELYCWNVGIVVAGGVQARV